MRAEIQCRQRQQLDSVTAGQRGTGGPRASPHEVQKGPWEEGQGSPEGTGGGGRQASPMGGQHSLEVLTPVSPSSPTQTLLQKLSRGTLLGLGLKSLL